MIKTFKITLEGQVELSEVEWIFEEAICDSRKVMLFKGSFKNHNLKEQFLKEKLYSRRDVCTSVELVWLPQ